MADTLFASLNGVRIKSCSVVIPMKGLWTADVQTDSPIDPTGLVTFALAGMTLLGSVVRSGEFLGSTSLRLVGGYGGWMKPLKPLFYRVSAGVRLGTVIYDAAKEVGEKVNILSDRPLGSCFTRQAGPAARLLSLLGDQWWVDPSTGITQIGSRQSPSIKSAFDVLADGTDLGLGKIVIATDVPADWQPGVKFSAPTVASKTVNTVIHTLGKNSLRTEIWLQ